MRSTILCAAATVATLVSAGRSDSEADYGGPVAIIDKTADQKPLMHDGFNDDGRKVLEALLRDIADLDGLSLGGDGDGDGDGDGLDVDFQGPQGCIACETLLLGLKAAAIKGDETFVYAVTGLCKRFQVQDDDVCEGSIAREGPIAARALRVMTPGSRTSRLFCAATLGFCSYPPVEADELSFPSPKPRPSGGHSGDRTERPPLEGRRSLKVVHYSDIHIDPFYVEGANANCSKPICCRDYSTLTNTRDHHEHGFPGPVPAPAGRNGDHRCDAPASLEDSMYAAIRRLVPDAEFALFTGDVVDHAVWNTTRAQNTLDIEDAYGRMLSSSSLVVYGTAGNHEADPTNSFPPADVDGNGEGKEGEEEGIGGVQWLYDLLSSTWGQWIGPGGAAEARRFGAYSVKHVFGVGNSTDTDTGHSSSKIHLQSSSSSPDPKLRIISLNTNLFYRHNLWLYEEPMQKDPSGQLEWLVSELHAAEHAGERVYILGHMPLGSADAFHEGSHYLDQIVNRYEATIAALFFGHTHHDEFQISYSDYENRNFTNAVAMSYIGSSMTPTSGHPSFRVYDVDPVTFGVLDVTTYIANMSHPDFHSSKGPTWSKYYSAKEVYGPLVTAATTGPDSNTSDDYDNDSSNQKTSEKEELDELTPAFWHNVTEALQRNTTALGEYLARKKRGWDVDEKKNDCVDSKECVAAEICRLRGARAQDNCARPSSKLGRLEPRRSRENISGARLLTAEIEVEAEVEEMDECEVSVVRDTLAAVGVVVRARARTAK